MRLGDHDQALAPARGIRAAEDGDAAAAHAGEFAHGVLDLLGVDVATIADHDVLRAAGDVQAAAGHVAEIARFEPAAPDQPARGFRIAVIAGRLPRGRGTGCAPARARRLPRPAASTMRISCPGIAPPQQTKRSAAGIVRRARAAPVPARERLALHHVHARQRTGCRKRQRDAVLREAVDRVHGLAPETVAREALAEALDGARADRLRAVQRQPPAAEVEALEALVIDLRQAQLVGEVRRGGQRAAVAVNGPEPALRAQQETQRRHDDQLRADVERGEAGADQAHVVVERQPAHEDVVAGAPTPRAARGYWRSRLAWLSITPFGAPVLPEVYCSSARSSCVPRHGLQRGGFTGQLPDTADLAQRGHHGAGEAGERAPSGTVMSRLRSGVLEDAALAAHMVLELAARAGG